MVKSTVIIYRITNGEATIANCGNLISGDVTIPSTLGGCPATKIGWYAFYDCSLLKSVTIPNNVTSIGSEAFYTLTIV